jgi:hypothetical protein
MTEKRDFHDYICRPFCTFYREGEKEELACQGAQAVEQLLKKGLLSRDQFRQYKKDPDRRWIRDPLLDQRICKPCPFRKEDCDFQSENPPPSSEPCGGYILFTLLKEKGIIFLKDLEKVTPG